MVTIQQNYAGARIYPNDVERRRKKMKKKAQKSTQLNVATRTIERTSKNKEVKRKDNK